ncbi:hypothetical protein [Paenibacillus sp.]|uniref:hypothetical protein n=1 Tax=Paenibacillus sp. TaxID=58172 RepID=UPI002D3571D8|nr:hypothetical protein [Paenibacillus sp.]HZG85776.1 hypothetical protein [Paenibacillus sp.]
MEGMETVRLRAGEMEALLEDGGLRSIAYRGVEIVRGAYAAVRDRDWNTVLPRFESFALEEDAEGVSVRFSSVHEQGDIDFAWEGRIRFERRRIRFEFDGTARSNFLKNRIGFCVLHPMEFAALPVEIRSPDGVAHSVFPGAISPHQPFRSIEGMSYEPAPGIHVRIDFDGDAFEMEDQRNWTDASYKTYCTPLELPFPVAVSAGQRIAQTVDIRVDERPSAQTRRRPDDGCRIVVRGEPRAALPAIGFALPQAHGVTPPPKERLAELAPAFLRAVVDTTADDWPERLDAAAEWSAACGCGLEIELLVGGEEELRRFAERLDRRRLPALRLLPFRSGSFASDAETLAAVRRALDERGCRVPIGGGSRAYYAELNRATLPLADMEFAAYPINPQVHAFDDRSLMETLSAQSVTAADAAAKTGLPLYIGPVTFKPRLNPNATSGAVLTVADQTDARQRAAFGAAWTVGSLAALCREPVRGISYYELCGPLGVIDERESGGNPLFDVFKEIGEFRGAAVLDAASSSAKVAALALREGARGRMLAANVTAEPVRIEVAAGPYETATVRAPGAPTGEERGGGRIELTLAPYGAVAIDFAYGAER